jgi:hypothetical protein
VVDIAAKTWPDPSVRQAGTFLASLAIASVTQLRAENALAVPMQDLGLLLAVGLDV